MAPKARATGGRRTEPPVATATGQDDGAHPVPRQTSGHDARGIPEEGHPMATDYDAPRRNEADELGEDSLEELKARRAEAQSASVDVDETDFNENLELPGADLSGEELTVRVLPKQEDEFTCSRCFLVQHRSRLAATKGDQLFCRDCAA
jgi:hypothetical protein